MTEVVLYKSGDLISVISCRKEWYGIRQTIILNHMIGFEEVIKYFSEVSTEKGQLVHHEKISGQEVSHGDLDHELPDALMEILVAKKMFPFYSHQAAAINAVNRKQDIVVSTSAASGKSLSYYVPILKAWFEDRSSRALYIAPTKALARDQISHFAELVEGIGDSISIDPYDGDVPMYERADIRSKSNVVLTNPDMLHVAVLPNHAVWQRFLRNLDFIVVDEAHVYRGVFGSHVANVLRRLRRICHHYGSSPQFVLASATLGNPKEHAELLVGKPFTLIDDDGAPNGGKDFLFWNPPLIDNKKNLRSSTATESVALFSELVTRGVRTLAFTRTRRTAELAYNYARDSLRKVDYALGKRISSYRAGYQPEERRAIEADLLSGQLLGVFATNALELGIDIGDLDATLLMGFPGSISSALQQAGRSGRRGQRSLSILVGLDNPLDQYILRNPQTLFGHSPEYVLINPENRHVLSAHLQCAAYEIPLSLDDKKYFFTDLRLDLDMLEAQGLLSRRRGQWYSSPQHPYPVESVNIRSSSADPYKLVDLKTGQILEEVDDSMAHFELHPGAIYLHRGDEYLIDELDVFSRRAYVQRSHHSYYTQAIDLSDLRVKRVLDTKMVGNVRVSLSEVEVTSQVVGYKKKRHMTEEILEHCALNMPSATIDTVAFSWEISQQMVGEMTLSDAELPGALHAVEHTVIGLLPLFAMCDRQDIGGVSTQFHVDTGQATIFVHDAHVGGVGIAEHGYSIVAELWDAALETIRSCPCEEGCPSCVQSPKCGNNNEILDKKSAKLLLEKLVFS